jgi:hypothetical protein
MHAATRRSRLLTCVRRRHSAGAETVIQQLLEELTSYAHGYSLHISGDILTPYQDQR